MAISPLVLRIYADSSGIKKGVRIVDCPMRIANLTPTTSEGVGESRCCYA